MRLFEGRARLVFILLCISIIGQLLFVLCYSVDVVYWDDFDSIPMLAAKNLTWSVYFSPKNVHRPFFPRILFVTLGRITKCNIRAEVFLNWILLQGAVIMLYFVLKENLKKEYRWVALFSLCYFYVPLYYENILWGFRSSHHLTLLGAIGAVFVLMYVQNPLMRLLLAAAGCFVASFSNGDGLSTWFTVLPLIVSVNKSPAFYVGRRQKLFALFCWFVFTALVFRIYLLNLQWQHVPYHPEIAYPWKYPRNFLLHFFTFIGGSFLGGAHDIFFGRRYFFTIFGVILCLIFITGILKGLISIRKNIGKFCLSLFVLCSGLMTSFGRANLGWPQALLVQYLEFSVLFPILVICMLIGTDPGNNILRRIFLVFLFTGMIVGIPLGWYVYIPRGQAWFERQQENARILSSFETVADKQLLKLHATYPSRTRQEAAILKSLKYNVFRNKENSLSKK